MPLHSEKTLLTGASGVVGHELLHLLPADELILSRYRTPLGSPAEQIQLDIRAPGLGLARSDYDALAASISTIIHCAANTDMTRQATDVDETNIDGARAVIDLAKAAGARLLFVSTAYCSAEHGLPDDTAPHYIRSKRQAEALVRASDIDWDIIRPSIVVGHNETGAIQTFQGFHLFVTTILKGRLPVIPIARTATCDFVPVNRVAEAIIAIAGLSSLRQTYWLTAGPNGMTVDEIIREGEGFAKTYGRDISALECIDPANDLDGRLTQLASLLPKRVRERFATLTTLASTMATREPFPSDMSDLIGPEANSPHALRQTLHHNLDYWARATARP